MDQYDVQQQWPPPGYPVQPDPSPRSRFWIGFVAGVGATVAVGIIGLIAVVVAGALLFSSGGGSLGEDPSLDRLYQQCDDGDMGACDDLYVESALGSELEEFGGSCGGRLPDVTSASCTDLEW